MALEFLQALHSESGEAHPELAANLAGSPPTTDQVAAATTAKGDDGSFVHQYVFAANDDLHLVQHAQHQLAAADDAMILQVRVRVADLADFDLRRFYIAGESTGNNYISVVLFEIQDDGAVKVTKGYRSSGAFFTSLSGPTVVGSAPSGSFPDDMAVTMTMRVIVDDSVGEIQLKIGGTVVFEATGIDTHTAITGSEDTVWGWGATFQSSSSISGSPEVAISSVTVARDGAIGDLAPQVYAAYVPDGVTADDDGSIFGGAGSADAALDEIPATDVDGITLDSNGDAQGLTFPTPSETSINTVQVWGALGDDAAGGETVRCDVDDGVSTETGADFSMTTDYTARGLTGLLQTPPGAASWDAAAADLEATLVRTT